MPIWMYLAVWIAVAIGYTIIGCAHQMRNN